MRRVLTMTLLLTFAGAAEAQSGTCSGQMVGTVGLAVAQADGGFESLPLWQRDIGGAECRCDAQDLALEIKLATAFPLGSVATAEIWVGDSSCTDATTRTSPSNQSCRRIATPSVQDFTVNSTQASVGGLHYALPIRTLFSVADPTECGSRAWTENGVYLFVFTDAYNPLATCTLNLTERTAAVDSPTGVHATRDRDNGVTVSWSPAASGVTAPSGYQVLCSDASGAPVGNPATAGAAYSVCLPGGVLERGLPSVRLPPATTPRGRFEELDAAYVCSGLLSPAATSTRLTGDVAARVSQIRVVGLDIAGNVASSDALPIDPPLPPPPPEAQGCSVGGASRAAGPPLGVPMLLVLAWIALAASRARRT